MHEESEGRGPRFGPCRSPWKSRLTALAAAGLLAIAAPAAQAGNGSADCDFDGISDADELSTETLVWREDFSDSESLGRLSLEGLWRLDLANSCDAMNPTDGFSETPFGHLIFNEVNSCTFDFGEFDSSATFRTDLYLPFNMSTASLRWWSRMDTNDGDCAYDNGAVEVRGEYDDQWFEVFYDCDDYHPWQSFSADLTPWIGQRISIRYRFETFDGAVNQNFGWAIDDVAVHAQAADCNDNVIPDTCENPTLFSSMRLSPEFVPTGEDAALRITFSEPVGGVDLNAFDIYVVSGNPSWSDGFQLSQVGPAEYEIRALNMQGDGVIGISMVESELIFAEDDAAPFSLYGSPCPGEFPRGRVLYEFSTGCIPRLEAVRARVQEDNGESVTDVVPFMFEFTGGDGFGDDCDGGEPSKQPASASPEAASRPRGGPSFVTSISDGGEDLFDCGNFLYTELINQVRGGGGGAPAIPYTFGNIVDGDDYFGVGSRYMTVKVPGLFMMGATGSSANYFWVEGNMGADGEGATSTGTGYAYGQNGQLYGYFYRHWFEDENCDAQQTQAFVWAVDSEKQPLPVFFWNDEDTNDQYQEIAELQSVPTSEVYYFNVAHYDPSCDFGGERGIRTPQFTTETLELIMDEFIAYLGPGDCDTSCTTEVESITITGPSPTNADLVGFQVTFSTSVTGFDSSDVAVLTSGPTFSTVNVTGGPQVWTVEIDGVDGDGDLGIGVLNDGSIQDLETSETLCNELMEGEFYVIDNTAPEILNCPGDMCGPCNFVGKGGPALDFPFVPAVIDANEYEYVVEPPGPYGLNDGYPHDVTVTVTDAAGNSSTCSYQVRVREFYLDPIRSFSDAQRDGHVLAGVPTAVPPIQPVATATGDILYVGDNSQKRQYAGFVHFQTGTLPPVENIRRVTVGLTRVTSAGNVTPLGGLSFDMAVPGFGASDDLAGEDFLAAPMASNVMTSNGYPAANTERTYWELAPEFWGNLASESSVQFRLRFDTPTDNDTLNDYIAFRSGNTTNLREAPVMIIEYVDPNCVSYPEQPLPEGGEPQTVVLYSTPNEDGLVQEYHATVGMGGSFDRGAGSFQIGDMAIQRGLFGILNFDTGSLPFNAVVISAELRMYCTSVIGNPNETMGPLIGQMRLPFLYDAPFYFGSNLLTMADDYEAHPHNDCAVTFPVVRRNQYISAPLSPFAIMALNRFGPTQFKVRWTQETDGDPFADQATLLTGNSVGSPTARPALSITYVLGQGPGRPDSKLQAENPYGTVSQTGTAGTTEQ